MKLTNWISKMKKLPLLDDFETKPFRKKDEVRLWSLEAEKINWEEMKQKKRDLPALWPRLVGF